MPSPPEIARQTRDGASLPNTAPDIGPEQNPESTQGGAPAGRWPSDAELPVEAVSGGAPANYGGFRPSDFTHPLPPPGSTEGDPKPPSGNPGY